MSALLCDDDGIEPVDDYGPVPDPCELCEGTQVCPQCGGRATNGWDAYERVTAEVADVAKGMPPGTLRNRLIAAIGSF